MMKLTRHKPFLKRCMSYHHKSNVNLDSTLSADEFISVIDEHDNPTGEVVTRAEMRKHNLWHRSTAVFVINELQEFCLNKRSKDKDYCPGFLDTSFGGIVAANEISNVDLSAKREAEEEMGLEDLSKLKLPGSGASLVPKFVFKH